MHKEDRNLDDKEKELAGTENSTDSTARGNGGSDEYEKICYVCRRPESKAGPHDHHARRHVFLP